MRTSTVVSSVLSLALLSKEVLATPPACLLACVAKVTSGSSQCNTLSNVDCVCQNENSAVKSCLDEICPNGNADAAYSAFKSSCSAQNVSLGDSSSSASSSASSSSTQASSSSASSTEASSTEASSTEASSTEASSTEVSSTKASSTEASTSETPVTSASITSVAKETTASEAPATSASSTHAVVTVSQGSGNLLQLGGSVAAIAAAALLI